MYIFEKLWDWLFPDKLDEEYNYDPLKHFEEGDEEETCEHEFLPVDSTGKVLACIKCGYMITLEDKKESE